MSARLTLFGAPELALDRERRELATDRPTSLLLYLAVRAAWVARGEIALLYHPDMPEAAARSNVRKLLHRMRQAVPLPPAAFATDGDRIRLLLASDRADFLAACAREAWDEALAHYRGPFLAGFSLRGAAGFSAWLDLERQDLARRWRHAAARRAEALEADGELPPALDLYRQLLEADELDEEAAQGALRTLDALGRSREALELFDDFRMRLQRELDVAPLDTTAALAAAIRREDTERRTRSLGELPANATPFVGRERELGETSRLLDAPEVRLLTLVGLGGIGKTRLAIELARRRLERYPDGVWMVPLAGVDDPERLPDAIAASLRLSLTEPEPPEQQLRAQLGHRRALLLLDNIEQLVEGSAFLCDLLAGAPGLDVVVTSRTPLGLSCETLFTLAGLSYPGDGAELAPADYEAHYEGVALFLERARRADVAFAPGPDEMRDIAAIVAQVAGTPLAIELAASWVRSLEVRRLRRDLAGSLELLRSDLRDLPERQRSVVQVLDYTWERLPPGARRALGRLAVFAGSFTLEAAEAVAGIHLGQLFTLIDRALLRRSADGRYQLHALVRQYARAQRHGGDEDEVERAHAEYFADFAGHHLAPLQGGGQLTALAALRSEWDDLLQAWDWAARQGAPGVIGRSYPALLYACYLQSLPTVERELIETALAGLERSGALAACPRLEAALLSERSDVLRRLGDLEGATAAVEAARRALSASSADAALTASLWLRRGLIAEAGADYDTALRCYREIDRGDLSDVERAQLLQSLGNLEYYRNGDLAAAEERYRQGLEQSERLGNLALLSAALINLGSAAFDRGDHAEAEHHWRRAADIGGRLGQRQRQAVVLNNLGHLATVRGTFAEARDLYRRSLELRHEIGDESGAARTLANLARLEHAQGAYPAAAERFEAALAHYRRLGDASGIAYTQSGYARTLLELGQSGHAAGQALEALGGAVATGDRTDILSSLTTVALVRERQGRTEAAFRLAEFVRRQAGNTHVGVRSNAEQIVDRCGTRLPPQRVEALVSASARLGLDAVTTALLAHSD